MTRTAPRIAAAAVAACLAAPAAAQQTADTTRVVGLDAVVVTADRAPAPLATSTAAVSVIPGETLRRLPVRSLGDALRLMPGFSVIDFEGSGEDPKLTVRGFYGAGEAEYVTVLVDGKPLNAPQTGVVDWDLVPLAAIQSVEVVRGGASSLYGDAAIGGVVNVITRMPPGAVRARATAGGDGALQYSSAFSGALLGAPAQAWMNLSRTDGYRDHAERSGTAWGLDVGLVQRPGASLNLSAASRRRSFDEPGPLSAAALDRSRTQISPLYRFDHTGEWLHRLSLDGSADAGAARVSGYVTGELRDANIRRTLTLAPDFGDTKRRALDTRRVLASAQVDAPGLPIGWDDRVTVGFDGSLGWMDSEYFTVLTGSAEDYAGPLPGASAKDEAGDATRTAAAGFIRYELRPSDRMRLSLGGRMDWLRDAFTPRAPTIGERTEAEHTAFSPRVGVNVQWLRAAGQEGWVFANAGRSFKAATPDQLFDRRTLPVPFEPWKITISNPELRPQYGVSYEAGLYHRAALSPSVGGSLSLAAYQVDMRDELDFDVQTFRYVNIGRSRHRGIEAALNLDAVGGWGAFANYTLQSAVTRLGENTGNELKAIPRHTLAGGVDVPLAFGAAAGVTVTDVRGAWVDDANTLRLPGWTRVDARLSVPVRGLRVWAEAFNVLDRAYSTTGFQDSADPSVVYYFPAAGRTLQIGISAGT
ncbi:TonB-dependent receptor [Longimicrobium sp.]|uniref:TonB-dependent receptor n=1 Tax=Longimicrobium sp. TaxID=2029185 RepID=UPI002E2FC6A7|nr:TonB-dependent receptor [Longimicrobium sp.]HEX6037853.1 TonB-dependent receptor [Longimicrobium sp.]